MSKLTMLPHVRPCPKTGEHSRDEVLFSRDEVLFVCRVLYDLDNYELGMYNGARYMPKYYGSDYGVGDAITDQINPTSIRAAILLAYGIDPGFQ